MAKHQNISSPYAIHPFAFSSNANPANDGSIDMAPYKGWIDTSASNTLKVRNAANTAWEDVSVAGAVTTPAFGSNAASVTTYNDNGAGVLTARSTHHHIGVTSLAHASNTFSGPITLTTPGNTVGITSPGAGQLAFTAAGSGGGGGGTAGITVRMDYTQSSDINGTALTQNTWVDILANQNFTVGSSSSIIEIAVRGMGFNNATVNGMMIRAVIDSGGTPINETLSGLYGTAASNPDNVFSGINSVFLSGLSAATHTIKLQAYTTSATPGAFYCRASSAAPQEFLRIHILEHKN